MSYPSLLQLCLQLLTPMVLRMWPAAERRQKTCMVHRWSWIFHLLLGTLHNVVLNQSTHFTTKGSATTGIRPRGSFHSITFWTFLNLSNGIVDDFLKLELKYQFGVGLLRGGIHGYRNQELEGGVTLLTITPSDPHGESIFPIFVTLDVQRYTRLVLRDKELVTENARVLPDFMLWLPPDHIMTFMPVDQ